MAEKLIRITGGDVTAEARPGEVKRILYVFESLTVSKGIIHYTFKPNVDIIPEDAVLPDFISVHMLPKGSPFPPDDRGVRAERNCYGEEPVPKPTPFTAGLPSKVIVGVDTTFLTSTTGQDVDAHWESLMIFNEPNS